MNAETESGTWNAPAAADEQVPRQVGPFKILQLLSNRGGMGIVYLAEQQSPVRRRVALKMIKPGIGTSEVLARFEAERQMLAQLDHPNIAKLFDAGTSDSGRPYFVMEYVSGIPITEYADRHHFSTEKRLELFVQVCRAVHHAHQKGIIHRDLKPSNILTCVLDGLPSVKVIDFGVARALDQRLTEKSYFTEFGRILGTPEYMSPEQAEMSQLGVDTATDIYSLGVILYELLVGALPFDPVELRRAGYAEMQRIIRETDPPRPSVRISMLGDTAQAVARNRKCDVDGLRKKVRGDLEWIVVRAMEKTPGRRYASATEFAADITRHLNDQPVTVGPPSVTYRASKFMRRNRAWLSVVSAVFVALAAGLVVSLVLLLQVRAANKESRYENYVANIRLADLHLQRNEPGAARSVLAICGEEFRGWEWSYLAASSDESLISIVAHPPGTVGLGVDPSGAWIASSGADSLIKLWSVDSGVLIRELEAGTGVGKLAVDGTGSMLAAGGLDGSIRLHSLDSNNVVLLPREHRQPIMSLAFDKTGTMLLSGSAIESTGEMYVGGRSWRDGAKWSDFQLILWDLRQQEPLWISDDYGALSGFGPGDRWIVANGASPGNGRLCVLDPLSGTLIRELETRGRSAEMVHTSWATEKGSIVVQFARFGLRAYSPDSSSVSQSVDGGPPFAGVTAWSQSTGRWSVGTGDGRVVVQSPLEACRPALLVGHENGIRTSAFLADGTRIVTASFDGSIRIWDATGRAARMFFDDSGGNDISFSSDGSKVLTARQGQMASLSDSVFSMKRADLADWSRQTTAHRDKTTQVRDTDSWRTVAPLVRHEELQIKSVALSPDGRYVASADFEGVRLWDGVGEGAGRKVFEGGEILSVCFLGTSRELAVSHIDSELDEELSGLTLTERMRRVRRRTVTRLDIVQSDTLWEHVSSFGVFSGPEIRLSPDWSRVAVPAASGVLILEATTGDSIAWIESADGNAVKDVAWSRSGDRIAMVGQGGVEVWDAQSLQRLQSWTPPSNGRINRPPGNLTFSADGRLATASAGRVSIWDPGTGRLLLNIESEQPTSRVAFSPDGAILLGVGFGTAIWDSRPRNSLRPPFGSLVASGELRPARK